MDRKKLRPISMISFLENFTLHDSGFESAQLDYLEQIVIAINFDLFWNKQVPHGFDMLRIQFEQTFRLHWSAGSWGYSTLAGATSLLLDSAAKAALLEGKEFDKAAYTAGGTLEIPHPAFVENIALTHFEFMNDAKLEILHQDIVRCCVSNNDGQIIDLTSFI